MEILLKQAALAPGLHITAAAAASAASTGSSSSIAITSVGGCSSWRGRNCRLSLLLLPKITLAPRGTAFAFVRRQKFCRWRSRSTLAGDGLTRVYKSAQRMAPRSGVPAFSRAEQWENSFGPMLHIAWNVDFGGFREGFEGVCRVVHFRKCGRSILPRATSSLDGSNSYGEGNLDLELEVFRFMQQSSNPDVFPTRQDLISAGRSDLVMAIDEEGGWLAAGWDEVETDSNVLSGGNLATDEQGSAAARGEKDSSGQRTRRKYKTSTSKLSSTARKSPRAKTVRIAKRTHDIAEGLNGTNVVREVVNAVDDKDGRRKRDNQMTTDGKPYEDSSIVERADLPHEGKTAVYGRKPSSRPANDDLQGLDKFASLLSVTEELKLKRPQKGYQWDSLSQDSARNDFSTGAIGTTISSNCLTVNGFQMETMVEMPAENSLLDSRDARVDAGVLPEKKRNPRKKRRPKVVKDKNIDHVNGSSDWIHQIFDKREQWMLETRLKSGENSLAASVVVDSKSAENRIHKLAAKLVDTRAALQSVSEELWKTRNDNDEDHRGALSEFIEAEDALEFRENSIMQARTELNTTRAQIAALEGNLKVELMEARKTLDERNRKIERAKSISKYLRTARVVWPNHAHEVYLTGSFNGWNRQVKMEKSSAGVFTCTLPLYPGKYEVKFVVDGSWRVDTRRPIVYVGGFENNVLTVS